MVRKDRVTLAEYLFRKLGYRKGTKAAAFIAAWGIYSDTLVEGERAHIYGYGKYWKQSPATCYRELAVFHEAFPDDATPDRIWSQARDRVLARKSLSVAVAEVLPVVGEWNV